MANTKAPEIIYTSSEDWILWSRSFRSHAERAGLWKYVDPKGEEPWPTEPEKPTFSDFPRKTINGVVRHPERLSELTAGGRKWEDHGQLRANR